MDINITSLRHDLGLLRGWILHWQDDTAARLPINNESIAHALMVVDRAKGSLERIEAERECVS